MDSLEIAGLMGTLFVVALVISIYQTRPHRWDDTQLFQWDDPKREPVIAAAEVLEQRRYGRWCGPSLCPDWTPGEVYEVDAYAEYILRNPGWGVSVNVIGDRNKSLSKGLR